VVLADLEQVDRVAREIGDDGLPHVCVDRTPFQQLWVQWVCMEDLALHLADCPDAVDECASLMAGILRKQFEIVVRSRAPYVVFPDNITAPLVGPRYFRKYCVALYDELGAMLEGTGVPVFVHMDGDLKPLADLIGASKVGGLDSFTPEPDTDMTAREAAAIWPRMKLGLNFPSSMHLESEAAIYAETRTILDEVGRTGRLQIQISENVPPGSWRKSYPQIIRAIREFGRPA